MEIEAASYGWDSLPGSAASIRQRSGSRITVLIQATSPLWPIASLRSIETVLVRSGWGRWEALRRFDDETKTFVNHAPDPHDPRKLQGGSIAAIHEDRAGTLWLASGRGLYRYDRRSETFTRYTDDGKAIDPVVLASRGIEGHYGLRGMPERAALMGGKLAVWSEVGTGTEVELRVPASAVCATSRTGSWLSRLFASKTPA
jgi:hypothetical protein